MGLPEDELLEELDDDEELLDEELLDDELDEDELDEEEELLLDELELLDEPVPELEPDEVVCPPQPAISIAAIARSNNFVVIFGHQELLDVVLYFSVFVCTQLYIAQFLHVLCRPTSQWPASW